MQENENKNDLPARDDVTNPVAEPAETPAVDETETPAAETVETAEAAEPDIADPAAEQPVPEAGQEAGPQARFLKDLPAGRFHFRFVPLHVPLGDAVRSRHFLHHNEKGLAILPGKHDGAARSFQIHHGIPPFKSSDPVIIA